MNLFAKNQDLFDEQYYLEQNPDIAEVVRQGRYQSGFVHFELHGKFEGRIHRFNTPVEFHIEKQNTGWTNHLTLKDYREPVRKYFNLNMVNVPDEFMPVINIEYPKGNKLIFERYFYNFFQENNPDTFRTYLPVQWTAFYVNHQYGHNKAEIEKLQKFINSLDKSKRYFTIVQYDDYILNDISDIDLLVYASGSKRGGSYPLPLLSLPLCGSPLKTYQKDIFLSFNGLNTHPLRQKMVESLKSDFVTFENIDIQQYYNILKRSIFALCPRGYGISSFRMFESMAFGCTPIYISDEFLEPFNIPLTDYCIKITENEIKDSFQILTEIYESDVYEILKRNGKQIFENYFVYSNCAEQIIKTLKI